MVLEVDTVVAVETLGIQGGCALRALIMIMDNNDAAMAETQPTTSKIGVVATSRAPLFWSLNQQPIQQSANPSLVIAAANVTSKIPKKEVLCFWCDQNGHFAEDCTAVLCVYCENVVASVIVRGVMSSFIYGISYYHN
jgi:hypothetical protein